MVAAPTIVVTTEGLTGLKVGQDLTGTNKIIYTLSNGTYAASITPANFTVSGLPTGLTAGTASRTSGTVVEIPITGTPTTYNASTAPFNITISNSGNVAGDTDVALSAAIGRAGENITLSYVLGNGGGTTTNTMTFTGGTGLTAVLTAGANTSQTYTVQASDAASGVIAIAATFLHTNLLLQSITFMGGNQSKVYESGTFTQTATSNQAGATGAVTYASSLPGIATVNNSGLVTIHAVGQTVITATKAADTTYAGATASYTLTVTNASQAAPTGLGQTNETAANANNGTITGVNNTMEYKLSTDTLYIPVGIGVTTITNFAPGTYHVRYAAKTNYNAGADATITIAAYSAPATTYTLTVSAGAGGTVSGGGSGYTAGQTVSISASFTYTGGSSGSGGSSGGGGGGTTTSTAAPAEHGWSKIRRERWQAVRTAKIKTMAAPVLTAHTASGQMRGGGSRDSVTSTISSRTARCRCDST